MAERLRASIRMVRGVNEWPSDPHHDWPQHFRADDGVRLADGRPAVVRAVQDYAPEPPSRVGADRLCIRPQRLPGHLHRRAVGLPSRRDGSTGTRRERYALTGPGTRPYVPIGWGRSAELICSLLQPIIRYGAASATTSRQ